MHNDNTLTYSNDMSQLQFIFLHVTKVERRKLHYTCAILIYTQFYYN